MRKKKTYQSGEGIFQTQMQYFFQKTETEKTHCHQTCNAKNVQRICFSHKEYDTTQKCNSQQRNDELQKPK